MPENEKTLNPPSTRHPMFNDWHPTKNGNLDYTPASYNKKVWWLCSQGHEWESQPKSRNTTEKLSGCPYCAGRYSIVGHNDLETTHPQLAAEWHPTNNDLLFPSSVKAGSDLKVWWLGGCGHEWDAVISSRAGKQKRKCPYCSNQKVLPGYNDLTITHPATARLWHPTKNGNLQKENFTYGSKREIWWCCKDGHEWKRSVKRQVQSKSLCPYTSNTNKRILKGFNDLESIYPLIAAEWHPTKNMLGPSAYPISTDRKVWWQCKLGHEWEARIADRTGPLKVGCRKCFSGKAFSAPEKQIHDFLDTFDIKYEVNNRILLMGLEIDILVPSSKVGIEFNGLYWHSDAINPKQAQQRHHKKWLAAKNAGIQLIQIWEDDWSRKPELVKTMLAHKLGVSTQPKVFAHETTAVKLTTQNAKSFMEANHIQGFASGSHYIGLQDMSDATVALLVLKKQANNTLNIVRYTTSVDIVDGFNKLLTHAEEIYQPSAFIAFDDHCLPDKQLYEENGFVAEKELSPEDSYVVKGERKHKSDYPLKRFRDDPKLLWDEKLTISELASLNKLSRIWDAGKTKYVKEIKSSENSVR